MATLIGFTDWTSSVPAWPTGTLPGHLVVVLRAHRYDQKGVSAPPEWTTAGHFLTPHLYQPTGVVAYSGVGVLGWRFVTAAALSGPSMPDLDTGQFVMLVTLSDTGGIGVKRTSWAAPAQAGGGVLALGALRDVVGKTPMTRPSGTAVGTERAINYGQLWRQRYAPFAFDQAMVRWWPATEDGTTGDPGVPSSTGVVALEVLPPVAPLAPTWVAPAAGVDVSAGVDLDLSWLHNPALAGGFQDAAQVQVSDDGGGTWSWLTAAGTLSGTESTIPTTTQGRTVPASLVTAGTWTLRVRTREGLDGRWSTWGPARSVPAVTPPTATLTGPASTVHNDLTPTLTWTATTPQGEQTAWRATVTDDATTLVIHDTGWTPGDTGEHTVPVLDAWAQSGSYTATLWVEQTGGSRSAAATRTWTMTWSPPPTPTVAAAPGEHGLDVTLTGVAAGSVVQLERLDPDGRVPVSTVTVEVTDPTLTDVRAPYGVDVTYYARLIGSLDGADLPGGWGQSDPVRSLDPCAYLVDAAAPLTRWLSVRWSGEGSRRSATVRSVTRGLGNSRLVVRRSRHLGDTGSWRFSTHTLDARAALLSLLSGPGPLWLHTGSEVERDPATGTTTRTRTAPVLFSVTAGPDVDRVSQVGIAWRWVSVEWAEADPVEPVETWHTGGPGGTLDLTGATITEGPGGTWIVTTT